MVGVFVMPMLARLLDRVERALGVEALVQRDSQLVRDRVPTRSAAAINVSGSPMSPPSVHIRS